MGIIFGIAAAILYGSGDYLGGRAAAGGDLRRVLFASQFTAAVAALASLGVVRGHATVRDLGYGAAAGVGAVIGLGLLYRALAVGRAGVVAPLTAVMGAVVPVTWGVAIGERPRAVATVGVLVAIGAAALIAREPDDDRSEISGVGMALAAGVALGSGFVFYASTTDGSGLQPLVSARFVALGLTGLALLVAGSKTPVPALTPAQLRLAVGAGAFDIGGTVALVAGVRAELAVLVAAVTALAPGFTVVLSWLLLHERLGRTQLIGLALALVGLVAIAAG